MLAICIQNAINAGLKGKRSVYTCVGMSSWKVGRVHKTYHRADDVPV